MIVLCVEDSLQACKYICRVLCLSINIDRHICIAKREKKAPWTHEPRLLLHRNTQMHWHANKHKHTPYDRLSHGGRFL